MRSTTLCIAVALRNASLDEGGLVFLSHGHGFRVRTSRVEDEVEIR